MANISSRSGWLVSGALNGQKRSRRDKLTDMTMVAYTVFSPKPLPRNKNPNSRRVILVTDVKSLADQWVSWLTTVEKPVMPPKAKWFGNLKSRFLLP